MNRFNNFNDLPDNIVLEIFSYLSRKELCLSMRVCRKWKRIGSDRSLWKLVDLRPYSFDLRSCSKFIRNFLSDALRSFHIAGSVQKGKPKSLWSKSTLSDALLRELKERCPNLKQFEMTHGNLNGVDIDSFPSTIDTFILTHSIIPCGWFKSANNNKDVLLRLTHLDLTESTKFTDADLQCVCQVQLQLVILKLNGCYRLTGRGMKAIAALKDITVLELSRTECDDLLMHHLCRANKKLQKLDLSFCKEIHDQTAESLVTLPAIKYLNLTGCTGVTKESLVYISKRCKNLVLENKILEPE